MEICTIGLGSLLPFLIYTTNNTKNKLEDIEHTGSGEGNLTGRFWA